MLDESRKEFISKYTCLVWVFFGRKPHPFGDERHAIACLLSKIMWFSEIVEGRYRPRERGRTEFDDIGKILGKMMWCTRHIWNFVKVFIMDSGLCVTKGLVELRKKGVFGAAIIKKRIYWPVNIKGDVIDAHFSLKEV